MIIILANVIYSLFCMQFMHFSHLSAQHYFINSFKILGSCFKIQFYQPQQELDLVVVLGLNVHQLSSRPRVIGEVS